MRGLDHLTFGGFLEFLVRPPAKEAAAPQVTADATAPPVVVDVAATPPEVPAEVSPVVADKSVAPRSRRWRRNRTKASSTLQGLEAVPEPAPVWESTPVQEPTELEPCKPVGTRRGPTRCVHSGRFCFYKSGSGRPRAHLASLLLLCPNTCRLLTCYFLPPLFAWNKVLMG